MRQPLCRTNWQADICFPRTNLPTACCPAPAYICSPPVEGHSSLLFDMSVPCEGSTYYSHLAFATVLLLLLVYGLPHIVLRLGQPCHQELQTRPAFQFLFGGWLTMSLHLFVLLAGVGLCFVVTSDWRLVAGAGAGAGRAVRNALSTRK